MSKRKPAADVGAVPTVESIDVFIDGVLPEPPPPLAVAVPLARYERAIAILRRVAYADPAIAVLLAEIDAEESSAL